MLRASNYAPLLSPLLKTGAKYSDSMDLVTPNVYGEYSDLQMETYDPLHDQSQTTKQQQSLKLESEQGLSNAHVWQEPGYEVNNHS